MTRRLLTRIRTWRLPRLRTLMLWFVGILTTFVVTAPAAAAADDKYKPGGIGDMMPSPITPDGQGTLFETYGPGAYMLDKQLSDDLTGGDLIDGSMHEVATMLMGVLIMVGRAAVTITQWTFSVISLPEVEPAIARAIGAAATPMATMFLPAALATGMFIAWARRSDSSMLSQLAWVAASAAIATTFLTSPQTWVKGVDEARQSGSTIAMTTIEGGLSDDSDNAIPFKTPEPNWSGKDRDDTIRKASDAVWRTYVATPWCVADLGSLEACKRWGTEVLKRGVDMEGREAYLKRNLDTDTVGHDAVQWRQGHTPSGRIGVLIAAVISAVIFAALVILLATTTLASLLGALMLLVCGVFFACLWCIPGRCRQWGVAWFETLTGLTIVSFTSTMLLGSVMVVSTALLSLVGVYGWLMVSALNIACAGMAFKLKGRLDGIVSSGGAQLAGRGLFSAVGLLATRRMTRRMGGTRPGGMNHRPVNTARRPGGRGDAGGSRNAPGPSPTSGGTGQGYSVRIQRARTYPSPPSYARIPAGSYGAQAAIRPGLPGGPGPSNPGPRLQLPPAGSGSGGPTRPQPDPAAARTAKADLARNKAGINPGAGSGYPVRPGAPDRTGIPHHPRQSGGKVIEGKVVDKAPNPVGAKFRTYPPAPAQPPAAPKPAARPLAPRRELPPPPPGRSSAS